MQVHVSIHDVSPAWEREVDLALELCHAVGAKPALLVVPDFHGRAPLADSPAFCERLRESREAGLLVSVATPQVRPPGLPLPQLWSQDYYIRVGGLVDQVVLMGYDTCQPSQDLYTRYLAYQVQQVGTVSCQFLLGLPTYQDNAPYHNPAHETLAAGLAAAGPADGVAIYAYWTTAEADWRTIDGERRKSRQ